MSETSSGSTGKVELARSRLFDRQYEAMQAKAAASGPFHEHFLGLVDQALQALSWPHVAFDPARELKQHKYDLRGVRRYKGVVIDFEYGLRIFYIGSPETNRAILLMMGERRKGKSGDAYDVFAEKLKQGHFDAYFRLLELKHAYWSVPDPPVPLHSSKR